MPDRQTRSPGKANALTPEMLLDKASESSGLSDFGDPWFLEPLAGFVDIINREADLVAADATPVQDLIAKIADRLRLVDYLKKNPAALEEKVQVAGVIIGWPRGGSTLLHRLLSNSPQLTAPFWWELTNPLPLPQEEPGNPAPRIQLAQDMQKALYAMWPEMIAMHEVDPLAPDEEVMLLDRTPLSQNHSIFFKVPGYMPWLREQDQTKSYQELKTWLQVLQYQSSERNGQKWILKSPHHLVGGALRTALDTFPEAKAIMTHRNLERVVTSYCSIQELTVKNFTRSFDPQTIGADTIELFQFAIRNMIEVRKQEPASRFIDIQYSDTVKSPVEQFRNTMQAMALEVDQTEIDATRHWMAHHSRDRHPPHNYRPEDYGMTSEQLASEFAHYHQEFLVE